MNGTLYSFIDGKISSEDNLFIAMERDARYRMIWKKLMEKRLETSFDIEFNKRVEKDNIKTLMDFSSFTAQYPRLTGKTFYHESYRMNLNNAISLLESRGWRKGFYDKQHWGTWLHSLSPYQGRIKAALVHWLIKIFSSEGDTVLDPFCGIGTVPLESAYLGRIPIGIDLNPYAYLIASAKLAPGTLSSHLDYLRSIGNVNTEKISINDIPEWIKIYFHERTLKEIVAMETMLRLDGKTFLNACLMGILHGNRPGYLSTYTGCIIPMKPRTPDHPDYKAWKDKPEYRAVIPRLAAKVMRMFESPVPPANGGKILNEDSRHTRLETGSIDCVVSSPPYFDTLDYVETNKVRLYFLGLDNDKQDDLKGNLIQDKVNYIDGMRDVGMEMIRVLKPGRFLVFVLGDVHYAKKSVNTGEEISRLYEGMGFERVTMVNDEIPGNKTASRTKRQKFDRILVMRTPR